jgi:tetratricopeptide (TPR) repeat protein
MLVAMQGVLHGGGHALNMRLGEEALASGLWETASLHFGETLDDPTLGAAEKSLVAVRLAESWIRDGRGGEALGLLEKSFAATHPEAWFWKGQALAGLGRFGAALDVMRPRLVDPEAVHPWETALTVANLELALGKPDAALESLASPAAQKPGTAVRARLHRIEILLDSGRVADARALMPAADEARPDDRALASFLEGCLLLAEKRPADAVVVFKLLLDQPQGQSLARYHQAAVRLADAYLALGQAPDATAFLLRFIGENPDSPVLDALFQRLRNGMPAAMPASDPLLSMTAAWITAPEFPATGLIQVSDLSAAAAWPTPLVNGGLTANALFTRADALRRVASPEARAEARVLKSRLVTEFPEHRLAGRALLGSAREAIAAGDVAQAINILESLRQAAPTGAMRGEAAFIEAENAFAQGDKALASRLFAEAASALDGVASRAARFNSAALQLVTASGASENAADDPSLAADLMLERSLAQADPVARRTAIEDFLMRHPEHPRVPEARMAAAEAALTGPSPDLSFARAQLDTLSSATGHGMAPARLDLLRLRIADLSEDPAAAITAARAFLDQYPGDPATAEASLVLGRKLYETSSYNEARMILEKLAAGEGDPARAEAAWLLAARSAALVPASQSQLEALILFDKVIDPAGPLAPLARLEKARLLIDMNRLAEAIAFLRPWFDSLAASDPLQIAAGFLLGEAVYGLGGTDPESLSGALAVYDRLLETARGRPGVLHRLQYLRGMALEQIPDPKDPARKREREAFTAYYSVLETTSPPDEWHYFELCGFRALALLEKAGRWPAAVACARKIASFEGPRAAEAAARASQLQLRHMIWED